MKADGTSTSESVEGYTPKTYTYYGNSISCTFQKKGEHGIMIVKVKKGSKIKSATTEARYGVVSVSML